MHLPLHQNRAATVIARLTPGGDDYMSIGEDDVYERLLDAEEDAYPPGHRGDAVSRQKPTLVQKSFRPQRGGFCNCLVISRALFGLSLLHVLWVVFFYDQTREGRRPSTPFVPPTSLRNVLASSQPSERYRENLRLDTEYITGLYEGDVDKQVVQVIHTLFLSSLTRQVAILPAFFLPDPKAPPMRVGAIFDLEKFRFNTGLGVAEWPDLKAFGGRTLPAERLACHSIAQRVSRQFSTLFSTALEPHNIEVSFFPLASNIAVNDLGDALFFDDIRDWVDGKDARRVQDESYVDLHNDVVAAEQGFVCLDQVLALRHREQPEGNIISAKMPTWTDIGIHLRFTSFWEKAADKSLRHTLKVALDKPIPLYIAVRATQIGDEEAVNDARERLGLTWARIVITGAEYLTHTRLPHDWVLLDHNALQTRAILGPWAALVIDRVVESRASAFIGSSSDIGDLVSSLRADSWQEAGVNIV